MLEPNGANMTWFQQGLTELGPILNRLARTSQVIWLNQYPIVEFFGGNDAHNTAIYSEKIEQYNQQVRKMFA